MVASCVTCSTGVPRCRLRFVSIPRWLPIEEPVAQGGAFCRPAPQAASRRNCIGDSEKRILLAYKLVHQGLTLVAGLFTDC